jgi:mono/diheme cytochrome c family protein
MRAQKRFPNVDDQITFVSEGSGAMPAFGGRLSPAEIREVVQYTRTL